MNNHCQNKGLCVQDDEFRNPLEFICVCDRCFFGDLCQFTTSQYSISLDALIGQRIASHTPIYRQSISVQLYFTLIILFVIIGLSLNSITITLFSIRTKLRNAECSLYIMTSSGFGICSVSILCIKFISVIFRPEMVATQLGCASMEYLLKLFPTICDWLNAFVSLDRLWLIRTGAGMNKTPNKLAFKRRFLGSPAKILFIILLVLVSFLHDPIHRQSIIDPRFRNENRPWCVVKFDQQAIHVYNITINIIHYVGPFILNLISSLLILVYVSRSKSNAQKQSFHKILKEQFLAYKSWILSPLLLALFTVPRLIFALTFTCITSPDAWQSQLLLIGYFIGFLPQIGTLIIFILPSKTYKEELIKLFKRQ
ncbi:unnamed protein product [Adineta steineri]|uniref:G-protein coupled receptors family 1 profile domain-containing protein n=1 Tax=Adineta steineri TaxID=433720 RepID=A0A818WS94_9BILA|nr:unnamed protein product [Adineta steineri]CAF3727768.1 unnamed protein product [Adineta steineri]